MKNENKCFFSISLENGITITGNNPNEVKNFISDLGLCLGDAIESGLNDKHIHWKEQQTNLATMKFRANGSKAQRPQMS